jgi:hypothetical protein
VQARGARQARRGVQQRGPKTRGLCCLLRLEGTLCAVMPCATTPSHAAIFAPASTCRNGCAVLPAGSAVPGRCLSSQPADLGNSEAQPVGMVVGGLQLEISLECDLHLWMGTTMQCGKWAA